LAVAVTAIAVAASVGTGAASTAPGASIALNGSGTRAAGIPASALMFSVNAHTPADSVGVYGTFSLTFPEIQGLETANPLATFSGVVTCLQRSGSGDTVTYGGIVTSGFGYDLTSLSSISPNQRDLAGDWFVTTVTDPAGTQPDTIGSVTWGDRAFFTTQNLFTAPDGSYVNYTSFSDVCNNPEPAQGTANQSPLLSGDIHIGPPTS
jgi:hypothetical protein